MLAPLTPSAPPSLASLHPPSPLRSARLPCATNPPIAPIYARTKQPPTEKAFLGTLAHLRDVKIRGGVYYGFEVAALRSVVICQGYALRPCCHADADVEICPGASRLLPLSSLSLPPFRPLFSSIAFFFHRQMQDTPKVVLTKSNMGQPYCARC